MATSSDFEIGLQSSTLDPFADSILGASKIHIRVQQRNGRKCITTLQGLDTDLDIKRIGKAMKKEFNCNGNLVEDPDKGDILQFQGDQRENIRVWLLAQEILTAKEAAERLVTHGF
jgi:translation initiation factor 1